MITQALLPVAGLGTRLLPLSWAIPKELLPIGRQPVLQWIAEEMVQAGMDHLCLVTSPRKAKIGDLFQADPELAEALNRSHRQDLLEQLWWGGPFAGTKITTCLQEQPLGLGHAILCGEACLKSAPFLVALGDSLIRPLGQGALCQRLIRVFESQQADAVIAFQTVPRDHVSRYGIAAVSPNVDVAAEFFVVEDLIEKPSIAVAPSCLAVAARYVFRPNIFEHLRQITPGKGGELQLTDALRRLLAQGGKVLGVPLASSEERVDVGSFPEFVNAFLRQALQDPELTDWARQGTARLP